MRWLHGIDAGSWDNKGHLALESPMVQCQDIKGQIRLMAGVFRFSERWCVNNDLPVPAIVSPHGDDSPWFLMLYVRYLQEHAQGLWFYSVWKIMAY